MRPFILKRWPLKQTGQLIARCNPYATLAHRNAVVVSAKLGMRLYGPSPASPAWTHDTQGITVNTCYINKPFCAPPAYQNAVREQKLAAEISAATRERDFYLSRVDRAKGIAAIKARKDKLATEGGGGGGGADAGGNAGPRTTAGAGAEGSAVAAAAGGRPPLRMYGQRKAKADPVADAHAPALSADVLSMIAGRK